RRYIDWHRTPPPPAPVSRPRILAHVVRRTALSLAGAVLTGVLLLGLAILIPVDSDLNVYGTFVDTLLIGAPLLLAGAFHWNEREGRWLRTVLTVVGCGCAALALADHLRGGHGGRLLVFAVSAAVAAALTTARPRQRLELLRALD